MVVVDPTVRHPPGVALGTPGSASPEGAASLGVRRRSHRLASRIRGEGFVVGALVMATYLAGAILLDFVYLSLPGDAVSRMANGFYALYSRDAHLAAIGFVWTPLTSIADMVPLLFKGLWPSLASHDLAGSLVTVVAMTGAVHQLRAALREWGVARGARLVLTALFALNPVIVYFGANGMSEGLYLFSLLATTRYLCRWVRDEDLKALVYAALALSFGYLARNETMGAALLSALLVGGVSFRRASGLRRARLTGALTDVAILVAPVGTALVGWATASYVITKHPFQQFQGNAVLVKAAGFTPGSLSTRLLHEARAIECLAPVLPVALVVAAALAWRRRDAQVMAPLAVLGGGLAFSALSYFDGLLFPWLRYYILAIPLGVLLVGFTLSGPHPIAMPAVASALPPTRTSGPADVGRRRRWRRVVTAGAALGAFVAVAPSVPASFVGMLNGTIGPDTSQGLGFIFHSRLSPEDRAARDAFAAVQSVDRAIEAMRLPRGSIVVDNQVECIPQVLTSIADSRVFVIPNDRDFPEVLADPLTFHTRFLLVSSGTRDPDTVRAAYPGIGRGDGVTELVRVIPAAGQCPALELYRVVGHPPTAA